MKAMLERELDTILTIQDEKQNKNIIISVDCVVPEHFMATYLISPISITTVSTNTFMVGYICSCVSYFGHYIWTQRRIGLGGQLRGFSNPPPTRPIRPIPDSRWWFLCICTTVVYVAYYIKPFKIRKIIYSITIATFYNTLVLFCNPTFSFWAYCIPAETFNSENKKLILIPLLLNSKLINSNSNEVRLRKCQ